MRSWVFSSALMAPVRAKRARSGYWGRAASQMASRRAVMSSTGRSRASASAVPMPMSRSSCDSPGTAGRRAAGRPGRGWCAAVRRRRGCLAVRQGAGRAGSGCSVGGLPVGLAVCLFLLTVDVAGRLG